MLYLILTSATMARFADALVGAQTQVYGAYTGGLFCPTGDTFDGLADDGRFLMTNSPVRSAPDTVWRVLARGPVPAPLRAAAIAAYPPGYRPARVPLVH